MNECVFKQRVIFVFFDRFRIHLQDGFPDMTGENDWWNNPAPLAYQGGAFQRDFCSHDLYTCFSLINLAKISASDVHGTYEAW